MYIQFQSHCPMDIVILIQRTHFCKIFLCYQCTQTNLMMTVRAKKVLYFILKVRHFTKGNRALHECLVLLPTLTACRTKKQPRTFQPLCHHVVIFCIIKSFGFYSTQNTKIIMFMKVAGYLNAVRIIRNVSINEKSDFYKRVCSKQIRVHLAFK